MKKAFLLLTLLFLTHDAWAANRFVRAAGGNYQTAGTWELTSGGLESVAVPTASDAVLADAHSGQLTIDGTSVAQSATFTGYTGTLTHNAFTWTVSGSVTFVAGMTYTPLSTSTLVFAATGTLTTGGLLMPSITHNAGTLTLGDNLTFMAAPTTFTYSGTSIAQNGKSINGNSITNRVFITSGTLGTSKLINGLSASITNADFRDTGPNSGTVDLSAITGGSGDCGGNTNITFTNAATQNLTMSIAKSWSDATIWTSRVPLCQDDVTTTAWTGGTLTVDMARIGKTIDTSGASGRTMTLANSVTNHGGIDFSGLSTFSGAFTWSFRGRGSFNAKSNGRSFNTLSISMPGGTLTLQDAISSSSNTLSIGSDTIFNAVTFNVTGFQISVSGTATLNMGSGTWTANRATSGNWTVVAGNTINANTSTIAYTANGGTFVGAGKTYNNVTFSGTSATMTGSNTFNILTVNAGKTLTFTSATTQTVATLTATGTAGNLATINAGTPGSAATLTKSSAGKSVNDYMSITDVNVTPASTWYYGNNSTYVSGTGWNAGNGQGNLALLGVG